jgi:hypothetical protein
MKIQVKKTLIQKTFRRLEDNETILKNDFHSIDDGQVLLSIKSSETIGQTPANFAKDRSFWRLAS